MTIIDTPFPAPIRSLFRTTQNYRESIFLYADSGHIPLGADFKEYPLDCSLFWINQRLNINVTIGPKGKTIEEARTMGMAKFGTISLDENATQRDVFMLTRAMCLVLIGNSIEVTQLRTDPQSGVQSYPILTWVDEQGRGICPNCRYPVGIRPAFPVNRIYRCPSCQSAMVHQNGRLDVLPASK
jgi:hypothetical protein